MADLYAKAILCDRVRIGGVMFQSGGERVRLTGRYEFEGRHVYDFDDRRDRGNPGNPNLACSHEYFHNGNPNSAASNTQLRHHIHFTMAQFRYFLDKLATAMDPNGKSVMENAMMVMTTELNHDHVLNNIFHMITPAGGKCRTGIVDANTRGLDLYNTMLEAMGAQTIATGNDSYRRASSILR